MIAHLDELHARHVDVLAAGYARALEAAGLDAVVVHAGTPRLRSEFDDQYWPLRPTPHFQHWLPFAAPDCVLIVRAGARPTLVWPREQNFWEAPPTPAETFWQAAFDLVEVSGPSGLKANLPSGRAAFVGEDRARAAALGMTTVNPPALVAALDALRALKTPYEVACLDEANRRAAVGHRRVADAFASGDLSELELHLLFLSATGQDDPETPYKNIVALGAHAATLHHIHYDRAAERRPAQSLLLDAGATCLGYCSDVTRTYVKGAGAAASTFADLVARTESMQQRLCGAVAVGLPYEQLHDRAHAEVGTILAETGVTRLSSDEAVASGVTRAFFPHGLGHSLGLQCHDVGCALIKPRADNPFLRNTSTIAADQVFTIEPGIYFIDALLAPLRHGPHAAQIDWRLVDELAALGGIRIEDDLCVRDGGGENLTRRHLP